jgi:HPt (histidine-containing phosphotransfer) domain-containing protein
MDKEKSIQAGIDYDQGVNRFMGNVALYEKYALKFLDDTTFAQLETAMSDKNVKDAFYQAHTLKGVSGNLSFNKFLDTIIPVVEALRKEDMALAEQYFPAAQEEYKKLVQFLQENK